MDVETALSEFGPMVKYAAYRCRKLVTFVEADDLYQTGLLLLVEIWNRRGLTDEEKTKLFKRDVHNYMHNYIRDEVRYKHPGGVSMVNVIDLDALFTRADFSVLSAIYAREFEREVMRLFTGVDRVILEHLLGRRSLKVDYHYRKNSFMTGQWSRQLASDLGISSGFLATKISNIRSRIRRVLAA